MVSIAQVELIGLSVPAALRSPESTGLDELTLVRLTDEDGRTGVGEIGAPFAVAEAVALSAITTGWMSDSEHAAPGASTIGTTVIGCDPIDREGVWKRLYLALPINARRGISIAVLSGVDLAVHDLAGKQLGVPVHDLIGGAVREEVRPYATVWSGVREGLSPDQVIDDMLDKVAIAIDEGYRAVKVEMLFGRGMDDDELVRSVLQVRESIDPSVGLAIDFGYRWQDRRVAEAALERMEDAGLLFAEAVLPHDEIGAHAGLSARLDVPICGAEFAVTRWEAAEWIEQGEVDIVQPGLTSGGGLTELVRIAQLCATTGVSLIPHGWVGGVGAVAQRHLQVACTAVPFVEEAPHAIYRAPLRDPLIGSAPRIADGIAVPPAGPGLGIELDEELVARFQDDHRLLT